MTLNRQPHQIPSDAVRMIARDDLSASVILNGDNGLAIVVDFEDERVGHVAIGLGSTAAAKLAANLATLLLTDDDELEVAAEALRKAQQADDE